MLRGFAYGSLISDFLNWEIKHGFALQGTLSISKSFFLFFGCVLVTHSMHRSGIIINTLHTLGSIVPPPTAITENEPV